MKRWLILLVFSLAPAFGLTVGSCTLTAAGPPERWHCANTGDPVADGASLYHLFVNGHDPYHQTAQFYSCGATIEIEPGLYKSLTESGGSYTFILVPQAGCSGPTQRTKIVVCTAADAGSCAASIAAVPDNPTTADFMTKMVMLQGGTNGFPNVNSGVVLGGYYGPPNNYELHGIGATTDPALSAAGRFLNGAISFGAAGGEGSLNPADYPVNITIDKYYAASGEELLYGPLMDNDNPAAFYRGIVTAIGGEYHNLTLTNGTAIAGGFRPDVNTITLPLSCTSAAGGHTYCTSTGIAATFGLVPGNDTGVGSYGDTRSQVKIVISGATLAWAGTGKNDGLNGLHVVYYVDANTIDIGGAHYWQNFFPVYLDSSGFGAMTGTVIARNADTPSVYHLSGFLDAAYACNLSLTVDSRIENNLFAAPWPWFVGGGGPVTAYAHLIAGTTSSSLVMDTLSGSGARLPIVGDVFSVPVDPNNGNSRWCGFLQLGGNTCAGNMRYRTGIATSVSTVAGTTTVAIQPYGPDGFNGEQPLVGNTCPRYTTNGTIRYETVLTGDITSSSTTIPVAENGEFANGAIVSIGASTSLTGAMNTTQTTITVAQPSIPNGATVNIDREHLLVTAGGGTLSLTVTRHTDGTTATNHNWTSGGGGAGVFLAGGVEKVQQCGISAGAILVGVSSCPNVDGRGVAGTTATAHKNTEAIVDASNLCITQYDGYQAMQNTAVLRNKFLIDVRQPNYGKGYAEWKTCKNCLVDGNTFTEIAGGPFIDTISQNSGSTNAGLSVNYARAYNLHYSNNLSGSMTFGSGAVGIRGQYYEMTEAPGINSWFYNNMFPQNFVFANSASYMISGIGSEGGFKHNTFTSNPKSSYPWRWLEAGACPPALPYPNDNFLNEPTNFNITDNLFTFGVGPTNPSAWDCPGYWPSPTSHIFGNLFIADSGVLQGYTLVDNPNTIKNIFPGNNADVPGNIGLAGTCAFGTYTDTCPLAPTSIYKGTASDGGDPGADALQVDDHRHGWSMAAGLLTYDLNRLTNQWDGGGYSSQWIRNPSNWSVSNTTVAATFTIQNAINLCSVHLYTNLARTSEHPDTAGGNSACNRAGNTVSGSTVTMNFGAHSPLTSATTYYPVFTDSGIVMTAVPFTTLGVPTAPTITSTSLPSGTVSVAYTATVFTTGTTPITCTATGLPGWATMASNCVISGTPSGAATSTVHVTATNGVAPDDVKDLSLVIVSGAAPTLLRVVGPARLGGSAVIK